MVDIQERAAAGEPLDDDVTPTTESAARPPSASISKNLFALLASQVLTWSITYLLWVMAPNRFGTREFDNLQFAITFVGFFTVVAALGTGTFLMKSIARDHTRIGLYVVNTLALKAVLVATLMVAAVASALVLGMDRQTVVLISVACLGLPIGMFNETIVAGLQGLEIIARPAAFTTLGYYVSSGLGIAVLFTTQNVVAFAAATVALAGVVPLIANTRLIWPYLRGHFHIDVRLWRTIVVGGTPFFIWAAFLMIYGSVNIPLLRAFADEGAVSIYTIAAKWVGMPIFVASIALTAFYPQLSAHGERDHHALAELANKALRLVLIVSIPIAVGISLLAHVLDVVYDAEYVGLVPVARVLALHIPLAAIDMVLAMVIIAYDRQRAWVFAGGCAAALNPALNLIAIPLTERWFDNGAIGSAAAAFSTELFMLTMALRLRPPGVFDRATASFMLRCLAGALVMAPIVLLTRNEVVVVPVAAGALTYFVASLCFGTLSLAAIRRSADKVLAGRRFRAAQ